MFDLETAIADWKKSLTAREAFSTDDIAELESHLRDQVSSLISVVLSEEEVFHIAQRRVGQPSELNAEFAKEPTSSRWIYRGKWMCIGILALLFVRFAGALAYGIVAMGGSLTTDDPRTVTIIYNWMAIATSWSVVLVGLFIVLRHDALIDRILQGIVQIPKPILIGLPIAAITSLSVLIMFNMLMTVSQGEHAILLSFYAYYISSPSLFLLAVFVLHRCEQRRALA